MKIPLSIYGVPLLGLGCLLIALWHPPVTVGPQSSSQDIMFLADPNPRQNKIMMTFLNQEAKDVTHCRKLNQPKALKQTIADYNLIASECTPTVFQRTHLPRTM